MTHVCGRVLPASHASAGAEAKAAPGGSGPGAAADGGGDWRLRAPERDPSAMPRFRPGAATWDSEDYTTQVRRDDRAGLFPACKERSSAVPTCAD